MYKCKDGYKEEGADLIITYYALEAMTLLQEGV
jgi:delta-aminolevulinic acid dehydratase/porphobilinogen synthase